MAARGGNEIDISNSGRGIWLVKIPKYLREKFANQECGTEVGRLKIGKIRGKKAPSIAFSLDPAFATAHSLPSEHKFLPHDLKQSLGVYSDIKSEPDATVSNGAAGGSGVKGSSVALEGQVAQKFECQPVIDENYLKLKRAVTKAAETPLRKTISIDRPSLTFKPKANHEHLQSKDRSKVPVRKRLEREQVSDILFDAFEKHQYYNIKDLQKITKQPMSYLREILNEMCDYNLKHPHRNMFELKKAYRHYKEDGPSKPADSDSD